MNEYVWSLSDCGRWADALEDREREQQCPENQGLSLEHNFGHGSHHLASLLLSLNLLVFLFHTVLDLVDEQYRAIRQALGTRRRFFQDLEALLHYF